MDVVSLHKLGRYQTKEAALGPQFYFDGSLWVSRSREYSNVGRLVKLNGSSLRVQSIDSRNWACVYTFAQGAGVFYLGGNCSQSNDYGVAAYDPLTQTLVWGETWLLDVSDLSVDGGVIYVRQASPVNPHSQPVPATQAYDASDGSLIWLNTDVYGRVKEASGVVYVLQADPPRFAALDASGGQALWSIPMEDDVYSFPALSDGVAYIQLGFPATGLELIAVDLESHSVMWRSKETKLIGVDGSNLIVQGHRGLEAIKAKTARILWSKPVTLIRPSLLGGIIWTKTKGAQELKAIDPSTGATLRKFPTNSDYPFVFTADGRLYIFDLYRIRVWG